MNIKKYKWKNRILLIETNDYKNDKYLECKKIYNDNLQEFHKRHIRLLTDKNENLKFKIKLIGFDGTIKKEFKKLNPKTIFKLIKLMDFLLILEFHHIKLIMKKGGFQQDLTPS